MKFDGKGLRIVDSKLIAYAVPLADATPVGTRVIGILVFVIGILVFVHSSLNACYRYPCVCYRYPCVFSLQFERVL